MLPFRALLPPLLVHALLGLWAGVAWLEGPFQGAGVVDGGELLDLARGVDSGLVTKSPLYPWLLGLGLRLADHPWTPALLGLGTSLLTLWCVAALTARLHGERAARAAAWLYCLSGSTYCFLVQPLPEPLAALLLVGAVLALHDRRWWLGGLLLGGAVFTRAPLLPAAVLLLGWACWTNGRNGALRLLGGLAAVTVLCLLVFGGNAWPAGGALNLRLGNGGQRSGLPDLRPGPAYDEFRYAAVFGQPADRPLGSDTAFHLAALGEEVAADPLGAAGTLLRKLHLCLHRTEVVTSADFRHGLGAWPPLPLLLLSFGLVVPFALLGTWRARGRPVLVLLPILAVLLANVLFLTSARYRFPMLPLLCVLAAAEVIRWRRPLREWAVLAALVVLANVNLGGRALLVPGDGLVQEAFHRMLRERTAPAAPALLERALELGDDPRAAFLLGLWHEHTGAPVPAAAAFARALAAFPGYAEAAENRLRALVAARGFDDAARQFARTQMAATERAGLLCLSLADLDPSLTAREREALRAEGHRRMALRSFAQGQWEAARRHAAAARAAGVTDERVLGITR